MRQLSAQPWRYVVVEIPLAPHVIVSSSHPPSFCPPQSLSTSPPALRFICGQAPPHSSDPALPRA